MGTYFNSITNSFSFLEIASLENPDLILSIHKKYIESGANLIRTNTFSSNSILLKDIDIDKQIRCSYKIAKQACANKYNKSVFVSASIGPIPDDNTFNLFYEYTSIIDCFLEEGCKIFIFETFSNTKYLDKISTYIKNQCADAFIITSFALTPDGNTRLGININTIFKEIDQCEAIDSFGINCGMGPFHSLKIIEHLKIDNKFLFVLPNAGYPEIINERTIYSANPNILLKF